MAYERDYAITCDETHELEGAFLAAPQDSTDGAALVRVGDRDISVRLGPWIGAMRVAWIDGRRIVFTWDKRDGQYHLSVLGGSYAIGLTDLMTKRLRDLRFASQAQGPVQIKAPMPGTVLKIAREGQQVSKGEVLCVLEAMKMQNDIRATIAGVVGKVAVEAGGGVAKNDALLTVTPTPADVDDNL